MMGKPSYTEIIIVSELIKIAPQIVDLVLNVFD